MARREEVLVNLAHALPNGRAMPKVVIFEQDGEYWSEHFGQKETRCKCSQCKLAVPSKMTRDAVVTREAIRCILGHAIVCTSAYRCEHHKEERDKPTAGTHRLGLGWDFAADAVLGFKLNKIIMRYFDVTGIAYNAKKDFMHVDVGHSLERTWSY